MLITILAALLGGCAFLPGAFPNESPSLDSRLAGVARGPDRDARLADLTDFDWDQVVVFVGYVDAAEVNARVGQRVLWWPEEQSEENAAMLVFLLDGEPVEVVSLPQNRLREGATDEFGPDVRVVRYLGAVRLVEP